MTAEELRFIPAENHHPGDAEAIVYLKKEIAAGNPWYPVLLRAIGLWSSPEENYEGRTWVYLVDGEAFDWLLLAERLTGTVKDLIPEQEREDLLFRGVPPVQFSSAEVRSLIGEKKYKMYLNYFYGITVEDALLLAVQVEVDKEKHVQGLGRRGDYVEDTFRRIYSADRDDLLKQFREEKKLPRVAATSLEEMKQFSYWLFKYRFKHCEKARIASDTTKALNYLTRVWQRKGICPVLAADLALPPA